MIEGFFLKFSITILSSGLIDSNNEVTYLYISGKVTVPKQSEFNVNSYNKDTVNFVNANVLI